MHWMRGCTRSVACDAALLDRPKALRSRRRLQVLTSLPTPLPCSAPYRSHEPPILEKPPISSELRSRPPHGYQSCSLVGDRRTPRSEPAEPVWQVGAANLGRLALFHFPFQRGHHSKWPVKGDPGLRGGYPISTEGEVRKATLPSLFKKSNSLLC